MMLSDKRVGWGEVAGGGDAGYEDAARKDMPFLPGYAGLREERNAFTHPGTLSPFSLVDAERKKIRWLWLCSLALSLCRETPRQSQEEETERGRRGSGFLPLNRQRLPMKGDAVQLDLQGDAEVVLTQGPSVMDARPLENTKGAKIACLSFLVFCGIKANLMNILS